MKDIILKLDKRVNANKNLYIFFALAVGVLMRFALLYFTDNVDFRNFYQTGKITASGLNLYGNFKYYNYGPIMFIILGRIYKAALFFDNNILAFKIMHVAILTLADLFIARLVTKKAGLLWGLLFFLNPISTIIDGYHTQFDNIAVACGAYGIFYLSESFNDKNFRLSDMLGIALLSLSLIFKHVLWAFPLWILFNANIDTRKKILYAFIPPLLFLLSFIPYWQEGSQGIIQNVFMYRSFKNFPLLGIGLIKQFGLDININTDILLAIFAILMSVSAWIFRREKFTNLFMLYTMAVVAFTSGSSGQQLVIPCIAMIIFFREKSWIYFTLIITRLAGKQVMLFSMSWCLLGYLVYYYVNRKNFSELY